VDQKASAFEAAPLKASGGEPTSLVLEVDMVARGREVIGCEDREAKGAGARNEDWAGVEVREGTWEAGSLPLDEVGMGAIIGFGDSWNSPGRDGARCSGFRDESVREDNWVADSRSSVTCSSSSEVKSIFRWLRYSQCAWERDQRTVFPL
jgi:hypothetical protein